MLYREQLDDKEKAYEKLQEIYNALPSPESFDAKLAAELDRAEREKRAELAQKQKTHDTVMDQERVLGAKRMSEAKQQNEQWKAELEKRQQEIEQARKESEALREKTERERQAREALSEQLNALEYAACWCDCSTANPKFPQQGRAAIRVVEQFTKWVAWMLRPDQGWLT